MKVLKICIGTWENASRDKRELSVCEELGAETIVLAKGRASDKGRKDNIDGFPVYRYTTRPFSKLPVSINRVISIFQWAQFASTLHADIITGHDIGGWTIGWLSQFFNFRSRPVLVYDSHEFEIGRYANRSYFQLLAIKIWEKVAIKKSAFTIVVNDSIADEIVKIHHLKERPVVVRNIPQRWITDEGICEAARRELLASFRLKEQKSSPFLVMYHGAVVPGRDVERLIELVSINPNIVAVILGKVTADYKEKLENLIRERKVTDRVAFHVAVPLEELWKYVGAADAGVIMARATCKNHLYSLPNKLFENIQAGTPVICPNYPAFRSIVEKYKTGILCDPEKLQDINDCVEQLRNDLTLYKELKRNIQIAKEDLCWENEKRVLIKAYQELVKSENKNRI